MTLFVGNSTVNTSINANTASIFANSTATALFVAANGTVGVGTSSTGSARLNVNGKVSASQLGTESGNLLIDTAGNAGTITLGSSFLVIPSNGNIGIATTSPRNKLSIGTITSTSTATPDVIDIGGTYNSSAGSAPKLRVWTDGSSHYGIGVSTNQMEFTTQAGGAQVWYTDGTEKMRLSSNGNVRIGSATASVRFTVGDGGDNQSGPGTAQIVLNGAGTTPSVTGKPTLFHKANIGLGLHSDSAMSFTVAGAAYTEAMRIASSGSITGYVDIRSPIFYDSNNTSFYVDAASASRFSSIYSDQYRILNSGVFIWQHDSAAANNKFWDTYSGSDGTLNFRTVNDTYTAAVNWLTVTRTGNSPQVISLGGTYTAAAGSVRSPLFYDSDNTGYYIDGAGTSVLNAATFAGLHTIDSLGIIARTGGGNYGVRIYPGGGTSAVNAVLQFTNAAQNVQWGTLNFDGTAGSVGTDTAVPFYIRSNASNRITLLSGGNVGVGTISPSTNFQVVGTSWLGGSTNTQSTIAIYSQNATSASIEAFDPTNSATKRDIGISAFGGNVGIGTQSPTQKLTVSGTGNATGDFRAPIFYDSDNTAYYMNPNDWSNFGGLYVDWGVITFQSTKHKRITSNDGGGNWNFRAGNYMDGSLKYINNSANSGAATISFSVDSSDGYISFLTAPIGVAGANVSYTGTAYLDRYGTFGTSNDFRAPIFYDSNNTAYYSDPNGTSVLTRVSLWSGTTSALHINDVAGAASYNNIMSAANDGGTKLVAFVNGSTRNTDGGNNAVVIRNDGGPFVLGSTSQITTVAGSYVGIPTDLIISGGVDAIQFNNATSNYITWNTAGVAAPTFTTRSAGTKLVLYPSLAASAADYAIGIENNTLWNSVINTGAQFKWYGGTTLALTLSGAGLLTIVNSQIANLGSTSLNSFATAATATEGQLIANFTGQNSAYLFNNSTFWGLYSGSGGGIIAWDRGNTRVNIASGGGFAQISGSARAPIFYDSDDTISRWTSNDFVLRGTSPTIFLRDTDHNSAMIHCNSNLLYVLRGGVDTETWAQVNSQWPLTINLTNNDAVFGGTLSSVGAAYSPIYYDRDNTAYYVNGNGTSLLSSLSLQDVGGLWARAGYSDGYHDITFRGYPSTFGAFPATTIADVMAFSDWGGDFRFYHKTSTVLTHLAHITTDYLWHYSNIRTPIFYDSNDTNYYLNPNGGSQVAGHFRIGPYAGSATTGNVTGLEIMNAGGTGDSNLAAISFHCQGTYGAHMHLRADGVFGIGGWSASSYRWYVDLPNSITYMTNQSRSNIHYDLDDTNYYVDPNSTTRLNNLTVVGTGSKTLIATLTASNSATLSTTALSGYRYYEIIFTNIVPVTTSTNLRLQFYSNGSYQAANYLNYLAVFNTGGSTAGASTTYVDLSAGNRVSNTASNGFTGTVLLTNANQATGFKQYIVDSGGLDSSTAGYCRCWGTGSLNVTTTITGLQVYMSSGNISTGVIQIWGWN
jgi:hypothetical protein